MTCFSSFFAIIWQKMKKNTPWKFTDESSVSGPGEFGQKDLQVQKNVPSTYNRILVLVVLNYINIYFLVPWYLWLNNILLDLDCN